MWIITKCVVCGKEFLTDQKHKKYCSDECKRIANNAMARVRKAKYRAEKKRRFEEIVLKANKLTCRGCVWKTPGAKTCVMPVCLHGLERTWEWGQNRKN